MKIEKYQGKRFIRAIDITQALVVGRGEYGELLEKLKELGAPGNEEVIKKLEVITELGLELELMDINHQEQG